MLAYLVLNHMGGSVRHHGLHGARIMLKKGPSDEPNCSSDMPDPTNEEVRGFVFSWP